MSKAASSSGSSGLSWAKVAAAGRTPKAYRALHGPLSQLPVLCRDFRLRFGFRERMLGKWTH